RVSHLHTQATGNLIPHTGVSVLQVKSLRVCSTPKLMQVARQAAGSTYHHIFRGRKTINQTDNLRLRQLLVALGLVGLRYFFIPAAVIGRYPVSVSYVYRVTGQTDC